MAGRQQNRRSEAKKTAPGQQRDSSTTAARQQHDSSTVAAIAAALSSVAVECAPELVRPLRERLVGVPQKEVRLEDHPRDSRQRAGVEDAGEKFMARAATRHARTGQAR